MAIKKGDIRIATIEEWLEHAAPKSKKHRKNDRSAKETARAWLEGGGKELPKEVHAALAEHPEFGPVLSWEGEPEAKLRFDSFAGETRNCDLAILARDGFGPYVLAIEAKADESYGETVTAALTAALERRIKTPRSNGIARIEALAGMLLRPRSAKLPKAGELRYQLLTACAGALAEADRRGVSRAVMLVHEFIAPPDPDKDKAAASDKKRRRNADDLAHFLSRVSDQGVESVPDGQLQGPYEFRGAPGVKLYVGKVSRKLKPE
jgi:hypothetical protein